MKLLRLFGHAWGIPSRIRGGSSTSSAGPQRQCCRLPGLPGPLPGPSFTGGFPGGCGSSPFPTPLLPRGPRPPEDAIAGDESDVDRRTVMTGGTVREYFPHPRRNALRSLCGVVFGVVLVSSMAQSNTCAGRNTIQPLIHRERKGSALEIGSLILNSRASETPIFGSFESLSRKISY